MPLSHKILHRALWGIGLWLGLTTAAAALETAASHAFLIDFETHAVLLDKNADDLMPPASMSKLMTVYLLMDKLADGSVKLTDTFPVSEKAWRKMGSKMFVGIGDKVSVEDLLRGIIVQSGNDACIVVAEALAGSEEAFAEQMTKRAREIGLERSTFANATGWPDPNQRMTARELALLAERTIRDHSQYYEYYSEKSFTYNDIRQGNRNPLLYKDLGADGLKTGHTKESGYGLTASAERDGRRLILVFNGLKSARERSQESERLLAWGFREFNNYRLFQAGDTVAEAEVWLGDDATVPLVVAADVTVTLPRKSRPDMTVKVVYDGPVPAPIAAGTPIARLVIGAPDWADVEVPLVAARNVNRLGAVGRLGAALKQLLWGSTASILAQ